MKCPSCGTTNPEDAEYCSACAGNLELSNVIGSSSPDSLFASNSFVGRRSEMAELQSALDDALSGQGRLVTLSGEPGIGKTRTAQELASRAQELGAQVLWGRCYEEPGTPSYWPWIQLIRTFLQPRDAEQLGTELGPGAAAIAEIVPEVRAKLPTLGLPSAQ